MFEPLDTNRDGSITREEMAEGARPAWRPGRPAGPGPHAGPGGPGGPDAHRGHGGPAWRMRGMGPRMFGEQGFVTREQMRERALARFDRVDADRNGTVTAAERRRGAASGASRAGRAGRANGRLISSGRMKGAARCPPFLMDCVI